MNELNTWTYIVSSLSGGRAEGGQAERVTRRQRAECGSRQLPDCEGCYSVVALERTDDYALLISWSDATRGHYAYQRWVIGTSRGRGRCALSGGEIRRGDAIYRPQWRGPWCPANGADMILAAALDRELLHYDDA
jgi:hypothetical protein